MRRCCEVTMRVLRENREALLILIEVRIPVRTPFGHCMQSRHAQSSSLQCSEAALQVCIQHAAICAVQVSVC